MKKPIPPRLQKFPVGKQRRLDQLLEKNSEGTIAPGRKPAWSNLSRKPKN